MFDHQSPDNLFVYSDDSPDLYGSGVAIGLRGTNNNRYEKSGGSATMWLRVRGNTVRVAS